MASKYDGIYYSGPKLSKGNGKISKKELLWWYAYYKMNQNRDTGKLGSKHPLYTIWLGMLDRCYNPNSNCFPIYGARGIGVCNSWMSLDNFAGDMGLNPNPGILSIDRIDNDCGYSPDNCRWATRKMQRSNIRPDKSDQISAIHTSVMRGVFASC